MKFSKFSNRGLPSTQVPRRLFSKNPLKNTKKKRNKKDKF
jgi:hypothetical protein